MVDEGEIIADGPATGMGELALGRNALIVGFMTWEGYNYEDAVLINENLLKEDKYTSIHIEEFECEARETKLDLKKSPATFRMSATVSCPETSTNAELSASVRKSFPHPRRSWSRPRAKPICPREEKLPRAIFGEKSREIRDTSLKVPHGESGIVVDVKEFPRETRTKT